MKNKIARKSCQVKTSPRSYYLVNISSITTRFVSTACVLVWGRRIFFFCINSMVIIQCAPTMARRHTRCMKLQSNCVILSPVQNILCHVYSQQGNTVYGQPTKGMQFSSNKTDKFLRFWNTKSFCIQQDV